MLIGIIGSDYLQRQNSEKLKPLGLRTCPLKQEEEIKNLQGLIISAWRKKDILILNKWKEAIRSAAKANLVIMGIGFGAFALGKNGALALMDYQSRCNGRQKTSQGLLTVPSWSNQRFCAVFGPEITFFNIAPNLGIITKDNKRGPVLLRQGNFLASSFFPELTKNDNIYLYFAQMIRNAWLNV